MPNELVMMKLKVLFKKLELGEISLEEFQEEVSNLKKDPFSELGS
jgi:hypothetical protein